MVGHRLNIVNIWWGRGLNWRFVCVVHRKTSLDLVSYLNFRIYVLTASNRSPLPPARDLCPNPTRCCLWAAPRKCPGEIWIEVVSLCCLWEGRRDIAFVGNCLGRPGNSCCNHHITTIYSFPHPITSFPSPSQPTLPSSSIPVPRSNSAAAQSHSLWIVFFSAIWKSRWG